MGFSLLLMLVIYTVMGVSQGVVKRSDDVNDIQTLQTLVQQQAAAISSQQAVINSQQAAISSLQAGMNSLQATVNYQQASVNKIAGLENQVQILSKPVAFTAMFSHETGYNDGIPVGLHQTLVFDRIVTNAGNSYSPTTGIFTAPLAGYYAFSIVAMVPDASSHTALALSTVKNGEMVDQLWVENTQTINNEQGSTHSVLHLAAGDQVWIRQEGHGDAVRGYFWTVFTGYLVHVE